MSPVALVGGGCTGPLLGLLLARRGHTVTLYERRGDPRTNAVPAGRSINLALADRGLRALKRAGLLDRLGALLVPMRARMIHENGKPPSSIPYGHRPDDVLWSVSRATLHRVLVDAAAAEGVDCRFGHQLVAVDFQEREAELLDLGADRRHRVPMAPLIAADGAGSTLRSAMVRAGRCRGSDDELAHGYKELTIPPGPAGTPRLPADHLHIWPRGALMLIALPNVDGSFTATLFMPHAAAGPSFASLDGTTKARAWFATEFPDALALMPDFDREYAGHPVGRLATVRTDVWNVDGSALLIGDAAHGIVPFHGQGLNACFEDCLALDRRLADGAPWDVVFRDFVAERRPNCDAIARMALENYQEMRDAVRDPRFLLQKELSLHLEQRHPDRFISRYSMVMFHGEIPYAVAERRGLVQADILRRATDGMTALTEIDLPRLDAEIKTRLTPLFGAAS